ncbi:methyl-accepting chemotaxis protein [Abyssisolibacter fermentans]|uniref:methyl-accepting chemotaxis protein n=1 Tax=Abyssisolibacter fermentans TaxID=1766203 RepID=UPI00082B69C1|nr:methyl-accepting chemotaxis protein [Abyssisolibacter fermentans]
MKLKTRLIAVNLGIIIIIFGAIISILMYNMYMDIKEKTIDLVAQTTNEAATEMQDIFNEAVNDVEAMAYTIKTLKMNNVTDRDSVNNILKEELEINENYICYWAVFEPNAFDGKDAEFANTKGSDKNGRYLPCWSKNGNNLVLDLCKEFNTSDYYTMPKKTKKRFIAEPETYERGGKNVTTVTFSEPIIINNQFIGVVGIDISLEKLTEINSHVKLYDSGFGRLLNDKGIVLVHKEADKENKIGVEFTQEGADEYLEKLQNGESFMVDKYSDTLKQDVQAFYIPIRFEGVDKYWSYTTTVPSNEYMKNTYNNVKKLVIAAIIGVILMGTIMYYNSNKVIKPIKGLEGIIKRLATFNLTFDENSDAVEYLKRKDEIGDMTNALAKMQMNLIALVKKSLDISNQVAASSEELTATALQSATSSEEIARTIEDLASGASDQAKSTEIGFEKVTKLGNIITQNREMMMDIDNKSNEVIKLTDEGLVILKDLIVKTKESKAANKEIFDVIVKTKESSNKIGEASNMINSIAEQTNLLALNAAIEAARAGEAGRGFAVVAEEIRKLAEQATASTKEIDNIVNELDENASHAVDTVKKVEVIVGKQTESVDITESKLKEVTSAIRIAEDSIEKMDVLVKEMNEKRVDISDIIENLSAIAEENAAATQEASASTEEQTASVQQVSGASENLSQLAIELQEELAKFKI